jgi:leucyl aminopeptidase (aminopeptidase T)
MFTHGEYSKMRRSSEPGAASRPRARSDARTKNEIRRVPVFGDVPDDRAAWSRVASGILRRSLRLRRGQNVLIEAWTHTLPFAELLASEALRMGVRPTTFFVSEHAFLESQASPHPHGSAASIRSELAAIAAANGYVLLPGPEDLSVLERLSTAKRRAHERGVAERRRLLQHHAVPSVCVFGAPVTRAAAEQFGVDFEAWRRESLASHLVDPVRLRREATPIARALQDGHRISIRHPNGTQLDLALYGRAPVIEDGVIDPHDRAQGRNYTVLPGGWVAVAVEESTAEGSFLANRPSRDGRGLLRDVRWTFRGGRLTDVSVGAGRSRFERRYAKAGSERSRPALLEIGLNPKLHDFPVLEDHELGVVTLYVGRNDDYGGRTRGHAREYALLEGADVLVDDRPILLAGRRP